MGKVWYGTKGANCDGSGDPRKSKEGWTIITHWQWGGPWTASVLLRDVYPDFKMLPGESHPIILLTERAATQTGAVRKCLARARKEVEEFPDVPRALAESRRLR
jgi:hypothetical protein